MNMQLRVLQIEEADDAATTLHLLQRAGYRVAAERCETAGQMLEALMRKTWDVVIAEYRLPQFDAPSALALLQQTGKDIPFIVVSGTVGQEIAIGMMKSGARDYLMKYDLARLAPAVEREIREARARLARRRAEEALSRSEERYRNLVESSNDWVWEVDQDLTYTYVGPQCRSLLGYEPEEIIGKNPFDLMPSEEVTRIAGIVAEIVALRKPFRGLENTNRHKEGHLVIIETNGSPVIDKQGNLLGYRGIDRDITERKMLEDHLRQSQKMEAIGVLAGGVAHDFNNLLTVINGYCQLMLNGRAESDPFRADLEQILRAGQRASSLTSQLLAFSRKQILEPKILNLNHSIADTDNILCRLIGEDINLVVCPEPGLGSVRADPGQIQQIIMNLVINARDAMPQGGTLIIETANVNLDEEYIYKHGEGEVGPYVMLAVSDSGFGMDTETRSHIFEPFYTTKTDGRGTGLGLSTVYGIVKQSGGLIWVYSEPGKGSTFKVYLPRVEGVAEEPQPETFEDEDNRGTETVLLVEDEPSVRELTARVLCESGYTVVEAPDGKEALRKACEFPGRIHLLVTDVVMPGMSGKALAFQFQVERPDTKVLFVSGYTDNAIIHQGVLDPRVAYLQKPFSAVDLARKVRKVLDSDSSAQLQDAKGSKQEP